MEILWSWIGKELYNQVDWKHVLNILKVKGERPRKVPGAQGACHECYANGRAWRCMPDASEHGGFKLLEGFQLSCSYIMTEDWSSFIFGSSASLTLHLRKGARGTVREEGGRYLPSQTDQPAGDRCCGRHSLTFECSRRLKRKDWQKKGELWTLVLLEG